MKRITLTVVAILTVGGTLATPAIAEAKRRHPPAAAIVARHCAPKTVGSLIVYPAGCAKPVPAPGLRPKTM